MKKLLFILLFIPLILFSQETKIKNVINRDTIKAGVISTNDTWTMLYYNGEPYTGVIFKNYEHGQLSYKVIYKYGKKEGKYLRFWRNGKAMAKGNYKYDKQEGEYLSYYKNGKLWAEDIYKNGQLIASIKHEN